MFAEQFDTRVRMSGVAVGTQFGFALGGFAPSIAAVLAGPDAGDWVPVAVFGCAAALVATVAALTMRETYRDPHARPRHADRTDPPTSDTDLPKENTMLDPDIARMLQAMQDNGEPPLFQDATADEARRRGVHMRARYYPPVLMDVASVEELAIPGPAGDIPVRIYRPEDPTGATVVFFHGGGWVIGDLDSHDGHARRLAATWAPWCCTWTTGSPPSTRSRPRTRTAWPRSSGPSSTSTSWAGAPTASRWRATARAATSPPPSPSTAGTRTADSPPSCSSTRPSTSRAGWPRPATTASSPARTTGWSGSTSATTVTRAADPRVSPLRAESHAGLAPAVIGIGHHDPLLAQNLAYAAALRAAGVPTVLREYPELVHGFFGMGAISAGAEKAADELCRDLRDVVVGN